MSDLFEEEKDLSNDTPSLEKVIEASNYQNWLEFNVCKPAIVEEYDHKTQIARVRPVFKKKYRDGTVNKAPLVYEVPVCHPRSSGAFIHLPIKKGDYVLLVFADRSLEEWLQAGGEVLPKDKRAHDITDAFALPMGYPKNAAFNPINANDLVIKNEENGNFLELRVKNNNHLQVKNNKEELVKVLDDLITTLREAVVYTSTGAQKLRHKEFSRVQKRLKTFLEG